MHLSIQLSTREKIVDTDCLIDHSMVTKHDLNTEPLPHPVKVHNVDGTPNKIGQITHQAWLDLTIHGRTQWVPLMIASLGQESIILGYTWLKQANPDIDWRKGTMTWREPGQAIIHMIQFLRSTNRIEEIPEPTTNSLIQNTPILPTTLVIPIPNIQVTERLDSTSCKPKEDTLEDLMDKIQPDEVLIAYVQGEDYLKVYRQEEPPLTNEWEGITIGKIGKPQIGWITWSRSKL